jgi:diguanylate cyclase
MYPTLPHSYDPLLVICSLFLAVFAAYTAFEMTGRVAKSTGERAQRCLIGGAFALGLGIWAMHFVGMLAFELPIVVGYDPLLTFASLIIAIIGSLLALRLAVVSTLTPSLLCAGGVLVGVATICMHYVGMEAMEMTPNIRYRPSIAVVAAVFAIVVSAVALRAAYILRSHSPTMLFRRGMAAVAVGSAFACLHYVAMAAAQFPYGSTCSAAVKAAGTSWLVLAVVAATLIVVGIACSISIRDLRMEGRNALSATLLAQSNERLSHVSRHDGLTGLPNRALLNESVERRVVDARRAQTRFSIMFMDLDGFKAVNDAFGHRVGDQLLIEVSRRFRTGLQQHDTVARVGGDEFILLSGAAEASDAARIASDLIASVETPFLLDSRGHVAEISVSVGIAFYPNDGGNRQELFDHADVAMYRAKSQGRGTYSFFRDFAILTREQAISAQTLIPSSRP